jgi:hypothetical protein
VGEVAKRRSATAVRRVCDLARAQTHVKWEIRQIVEIEALTEQMRQDWDLNGEDFESRRRFVEMLNVRETLKIENGQKVLYVLPK